MKIVELVSSYSTVVTNEELDFMASYPKSVKISSLGDHDQWLAQNLIRKGVYSISSDNNTIINDATSSNSK